MKSPVIGREVRYRLNSGDTWAYRRVPLEPQITLPGLVRGETYDVEVCNLGLLGTRSAWVPLSVAVSSTVSTGIYDTARELDILNGTVTLDSGYRNFRLTLSANATVAFSGTWPMAAVVTLEVEQWGGGNTLTHPGNVAPVSGVPHAMTATAGAVDIITYQTTNGGVTWYQTVFQAGVAFAGTISPSPATGTSATDGVTPSAPSVTVTMTTANGTAPVTYAWVRDDAGGTNFSIDNAAIAAPTFSIASGTTGYGPTTQRWRCTATDDNGLVCQATVNVTIARSVTGGLAVSLSPNPASDFAVYPNNPEVTVVPTVTGATGSYSGAWSRVDVNGGSDFTLIGNTFSMTPDGSYYMEREQTWRYTVTDTVGSTFEDVVVTLVHEI